MLKNNRVAHLSWVIQNIWIVKFLWKEKFPISMIMVNMLKNSCISTYPKCLDYLVFIESVWRRAHFYLDAFPFDLFKWKQHNIAVIFTYQDTNNLAAIISRIPVYSYTFCSCNGSAPNGRLAITWTNATDGLVQDCSISIANALEILQSCTKPSIWWPSSLAHIPHRVLVYEGYGSMMWHDMHSTDMKMVVDNLLSCKQQYNIKQHQIKVLEIEKSPKLKLAHQLGI